MFVSEDLAKIEESDDTPQEFDKFWNEEQQKAFKQLIKDKKPSVLQRKKLGDQILKRILSFVEIFNSGK